MSSALSVSGSPAGFAPADLGLVASGLKNVCSATSRKLLDVESSELRAAMNICTERGCDVGERYV
jgi:hypothetical protein